MSERSVQHAAVVRDRGVPELQELVASGKTAILEGRYRIDSTV